MSEGQRGADVDCSDLGSELIDRKQWALTRRELLVLAGVSVSALALPGCGSGNSSTGSRAFFSSKNVVVKPNVVVLPDDKSVTLSNITDTSVTLSGKVPSLQPGSM